MPRADEERIWALHCKGVAPSAIDERLRLEPGTAVAVIAGMWAADRQRAKEARRDA